jgi:hypothetical protein
MRHLVRAKKKPASVEGSPAGFFKMVVRSHVRQPTTEVSRSFDVPLPVAPPPE